MEPSSASHSHSSAFAAAGRDIKSAHPPASAAEGAAPSVSAGPRLMERRQRHPGVPFPTLRAAVQADAQDLPTYAFERSRIWDLRDSWRHQRMLKGMRAALLAGTGPGAGAGQLTRAADVRELETLRAQVGTPRFMQAYAEFKRRLQARPQLHEAARSTARESVAWARVFPDRLEAMMRELPPSQRLTPQGRRLFEALVRKGADGGGLAGARVVARLHLLLLNDAAAGGAALADEGHRLRRLCEAFNFVAPGVLAAEARRIATSAKPITAAKAAQVSRVVKAASLDSGLSPAAQDQAKADRATRAARLAEFADALAAAERETDLPEPPPAQAAGLQQATEMLRRHGLLRCRHFTDLLGELRRSAGDAQAFAAVKAKIDTDARRALAQRDTPAASAATGTLPGGDEHWWPQASGQLTTYLDATARQSQRAPMVAAGGHFSLLQATDHRMTGQEALDFPALERLRHLGLDLGQPAVRQALEREVQAEFFNLLVSEYGLRPPPKGGDGLAQSRVLMARALNSVLSRRQFGEHPGTAERDFRVKLLDQVHADMQGVRGVPAQFEALERSLAQVCDRVDHGDFVNLYIALRLKVAAAYDDVVKASGFERRDYESSFAAFAAIRHARGGGMLAAQEDISAVWRFNQAVGDSFKAFRETGRFPGAPDAAARDARLLHDALFGEHGLTGEPGQASAWQGRFLAHVQALCGREPSVDIRAFEAMAPAEKDALMARALQHVLRDVTQQPDAPPPPREVPAA